MVSIRANFPRTTLSYHRKGILSDCHHRSYVVGEILRTLLEFARKDSAIESSYTVIAEATIDNEEYYFERTWPFAEEFALRCVGTEVLMKLEEFAQHESGAKLIAAVFDKDDTNGYNEDEQDK